MAPAGIFGSCGSQEWWDSVNKPLGGNGGIGQDHDTAQLSASGMSVNTHLADTQGNYPTMTMGMREGKTDE